MSTPSQFARATSLLCSDIGIFSVGETPLPTVQSAQMGGVVLVDASVLRTYEQMIAQLERQVYRYRAIFEHLVARTKPVEEPARLSPPLNAASVALLNTIIGARLHEEHVLKAFGDEEP